MTKDLAAALLASLRVPRLRRGCPLTTDPGYEATGCGLDDTGTDCSMAGIASGCWFREAEV